MQLWQTIIGWKGTSTRGSNMRCAFSRTGAVLCGAYLIFATFDFSIQQTFLAIYGWIMLAFAAIFFAWVVVFPTLLDDQGFVVNTKRLLADTILSAFLIIAAFAVIYQLHGLAPPDHQIGEMINLDYAYFSAVTFSTLGFGDFTPLASAGLFAASEALLGNVHLGFVVGTIFVIVNDARSRQSNTNDQSTNGRNSQRTKDERHDRI